MKYITLGVIGHVDHGKTALVKALTGTDTDRLKEEQERGISIVLGYTHLEDPRGRIGIVDVPGHEKFIRTMISGATAIEAVLLVVDVNEGVKPQTVEHLEIAQLLGIERGVIAVTKCDSAQPGRRESTLEDLEILLDGSFLEGAPVVFTSSVSGEGLDGLREALGAIVEQSLPPRDEGFAYLPVDRVFTMSGFGTVLTGTLRRGTLTVDDEVAIYPKGTLAKVRELQSHNAFTERVGPGHRCAVNLRGVEKTQVLRGDIVATPGTLTPLPVVDAQLTLLKDAGAPLKHGQALRLLFGCQETYPRVHLLDRDKLAPGETCVLQLRHEENAAVLTGEPFIVRTYSPMRTVGGGIVLGASAVRYRRRDRGVIETLEILARRDPGAIVESQLQAAGLTGMTLQGLCNAARLSADAVRESLNEQPVVVLDADRTLHRTHYDGLRKTVAETVAGFHKANPTLLGMPKTQLSLGVDSALLEHAIAGLEGDGTVVVEKGLMREAGFDPAQALSQSERALACEIEEAFKSAALQPPSLDEVLVGDKPRIRIYRYLVDSKTLFPTFIPNKARSTNSTIVFHRDTIASAKARLTGAFMADGRFTTAQAKELLAISRKYLVPLLEHLDAAGFTKRSEDYRVFLK